MSLIIRNATPADAAALSEVHVRSWQTAYDKILPKDFLDSLTEQIPARTRSWTKHLALPEVNEKLFLAELDGRVVGMCDGSKNRDADLPHDAEIYAIYLLAEYRGQGIGDELAKVLVRHFLKRGWKSMNVWVLKDNPARAFYEKLGGKYLKEKMIKIGDREYPEVCYEWSDISKIF